MQNDFVSAILISHNAPQYFSRTLDAVKQQPINELVVVETGEQTSTDFFHLPNAKLADALNFAFDKTSPAAQWLWILHDDSAPLPGALSELLKVAELSPSVAIVGPKLVDWNNSRMIQQQGLTLTSSGALFSLVSDELDQSQHDSMSDVLAVGTAGLLIKREVWQQLAGLSGAMPPLAADLDLSMRARLAGHRVVVAPQARVAHASLSLNNQRERGWLRVQAKSALRRAELQLRLSYAPLGLALLFWFFLPILTTGRLIWRVWNKRPDRLLGDSGAAIWAYFTIAKRLTVRRRVTNRRALRALYATKQQVKNEKRQNAEAEEIEARLEAHAALAERDQSSPNTEQLLLGVGSNSKSFIAAGGLWFVAGLLALSYKWFPSGEAIIGGGSIPLNANWFEVFLRAGASWQPIGDGFAAPADPFVWVLTLLSLFTFWAPSLAIGVLVFAAKAIAFFAAFKAIGLFTKKTWVRNLAALVYALWPSLTDAQTEARIPTVIAQIVLPLLVFTVSRVALFGVELSVRSRQQIWTWVGLSGLLLAIEIASAPSTALIILPALLVVLIARAKRIGYLIWIAVPLLAAFGPLAIWLLFHGPLNFLADPGVPQATKSLPSWQLLLGGGSLPFVFTTAVTLLLALLALLTARRAVAWLTMLVGLLATGAAVLITGVQFNAIGVIATEQNSVTGSPQALLAIWGLAVACALAITLESIKRRAALQIAAGALIAIFVLPMAAVTAIAKPEAYWSTARVMPALIAAQSNDNIRVLNITAEKDSYTASLESADGVQLEDSSVAYRATAPENSLAQLTADLVSGGSANVAAELQKQNIAYVLVPKNSADLATTLDSVAELEGAGETDFGKIWRVRNYLATEIDANQSPWSVTKALQLIVLVSFVLLAVPTSGRKRAAATSQIFDDSSDSND